MRQVAGRASNNARVFHLILGHFGADKRGELMGWANAMKGLSQ
jgi:hypothetical protein